MRILIHAVSCTKWRKPFLEGKILDLVLHHIRENAERKSIKIDVINGHVDHIHCLFEDHPTYSNEKVIQLLKGESAHWINKMQLTGERFAWAVGYYAKTHFNEAHEVRAYIKNQAAHHGDKKRRSCVPRAKARG